MVISGPRPHIGRTATVEIIGNDNTWYPLIVIAGQHKVTESQRFGDKVSTGAISYQDFQPSESAAVSAHFQGGYGLREYTDLVLTPRDPATYVKESSNVDTSSGIAILSPAIPAETLPNSTAPVVWMGELTISGTLMFYAVCGFQGKCIYQRGTGGTWTQCTGTTAGAPVAGAVGSFNGRLLLGYGAAVNTPAQVTQDGGATYANVTQDGTGTVFVAAYTGDKVAAYIAGGITGDWGVNGRGGAQVMSSTDGASFQLASKVKCGNPDWPITGLAPGGGLVILYVAKQNELGEIDTSGVYRTLFPFESVLPRNGLGMRWYFARGAGSGPGAPALATPEGGSDAVGPLVLLVPRDNQLWMYSPSSTSGGQAQNLTVWANPEFRPPNVHGETKAMLGTARWLYSAITDEDGHTWILKRDGRTGATHVYLDLGVQTCTALGWTALNGATVGTINHLLVGYGNNLVNVTLPQHTEFPPDDTNCRYQTSGTVDMPDQDLGFFSEPKILFSVEVVADNLSLNSTCEILYGLDGGALQVLGTASQGPVTEILFPDPRPTARLTALRATLTTTDTTQTPQLRALVLRCSINPKLYRQWSIVAIVPAGAGAFPSDALRNPKAVIDGLWAIRRAGVPVIFVDRWKARSQVRIMAVEETEMAREPGGPLETAVVLQLLEVNGQAALTGQVVFTMATWTYLWFPMSFPGATETFPLIGPATLTAIMGPAVLTGSATVTNNESSAVYPTFQIAGPGHIPTLKNGASTWTLNTDVPDGAVITIQFDPTKHTVVAQDGTDYSGFVLGGSTWWSLAAGANSVSVTMGGATSPASIITLQYPL